MPVRRQEGEQRTGVNPAAAAVVAGAEKFSGLFSPEFSRVSYGWSCLSPVWP